MTKKTYRRLVVGYLQWSIIGLIIALFVAFITSDHRSVVYGVPAAESSVAGVSGDPAPLPLASPLPSAVTAPASAPKVSTEKVVPDTINGQLFWPDPWDQISDIPLRNY
jgi:hypothetical protein